MTASSGVNAEITQPGGFEATRIQVVNEVKQILSQQLSKYCPESCEIIKINAEIKEEISEDTELGFEAVGGISSRPKLYADQISAEVQVDERVTLANRDRLKNILLNHMQGKALNVELNWRPIQLPNIGNRSSSAQALREKLESKIDRIVRHTLQTYCPSKCLLGLVTVDGQLISLDEANDLPSSQLARDATGQSVLRIDDVQVEVSVDESVDESLRDQISQVLRVKTRFVSPISFNMTVSSFPKTYSQSKSEERAEDPYGLEKLRRMLIMFRDLAGTKEIITSTTNSDSQSQSVTDRNSVKSESSSLEENRSRVSDSSRSTDQQSEEVDWMVWGSLALGSLLVLVVALRFAQANKDAKMMVSASEGSANQGSRSNSYDEHGRPVVLNDSGGISSGSGVQNLALKLQVEKLKDELVQHFMTAPKVAKETFSRMLKEDGVEATANYLHIFGHLIVMELITDPNMTRDIYALSEFFHNTEFQMTLEDELSLLQELKRKHTASEIRVLSTTGSDKFDFLSKLDPAQIYTLISEEKPQVQSIVLTQLPKKRRMSVYDMYHGSAKVILMNELCQADAVPKEYMINIAKALHKKVFSRPEFDTENIRSSEIIVDLMERSELQEQKDIMANLHETNGDTARAIMMKLITIEFLPYLKSGHLLELVLGMDHHDLITFLTAAPEHIRDLLLSKVPEELSESWMEDLEHTGSVDESNYRMVELKIFNKIRAMSNSGVINILDINEVIFAPDNRSDQDEGHLGQLSNDSMVA